MGPYEGFGYLCRWDEVYKELGKDSSAYVEFCGERVVGRGPHPWPLSRKAGEGSSNQGYLFLFFQEASKQFRP